MFSYDIANIRTLLWRFWGEEIDSVDKEWVIVPTEGKFGYGLILISFIAQS